MQPIAHRCRSGKQSRMIVLAVALALFGSACSAGGDRAGGEGTEVTGSPVGASSSASVPSSVTERPTTASSTASSITESPTVASSEPPATFWAIEAANYDLIEIEVATGREVRRIAGWGAELADPDAPGGGQALQRVDVATDGWLWVDDCCEPAAGNIFGLDPDHVDRIDEVVAGAAPAENGRRLIGLGPIASPDGSLVAYANYVIDVAVIARDGRQVSSLVGGYDGTFATPLAWIDDVTLAVAEQGIDGVLVSVWDLTVPSAPAARGEAIPVDGAVVDATPWADGEVMVVLGPEPFDDPERTGVLIGRGTVVPVEVPDGLLSIDLDPSGRHALHVGADHLARFGLLDGTAPVLSDIEVVWASW